MGFVLHLLVLFFCFFTCLCITKRSARLVCVSKSAEGPDVPLQNTKTKSSPDNYSKAPGVAMRMYTYTTVYSQTGSISLFVVFLSLSLRSQQGPQLLLARTPLTSSSRRHLRSTGTAFSGFPSSCSLFQPDCSVSCSRNQAYLPGEPRAWEGGSQRGQEVFWGLAAPLQLPDVSPPGSRFPD